jgi:hypothetical protein
VTVKGICFSTSCKAITDMGIRKYGLSCIENMKSGMVWRKILGIALSVSEFLDAANQNFK